MGAFFIIGASRGLGLALVDQSSQDKSNVVIGTVRSINNATSEVFKRKNVHLIELDVTQPLEDFHKAFQALDKFAPEGLDVVVYNAGVLNSMLTDLRDITAEGYLNDFNVNFVGGTKGWTAVIPYLYKGSGVKRMVYISSIAAQIEEAIYATRSYGISKVAVNHYVKQISVANNQSENVVRKNSITLALHPGVVDTDMVQKFRKELEDVMDVMQIPSAITPEQSAKYLIDTVLSSTKEQDGSFADEQGNALTY